MIFSDGPRPVSHIYHPCMIIMHRLVINDINIIVVIAAASASTSSASMHKPLPRILKLQLDNCVSDNKNRFVLAYLSLLTSRQVFEEIHLGFLMVGHTHEDVDAMFGNFSETLMHHPAHCLPDLMGLLMKARKPTPVPHFVQEVPDFKKYLEPFMLTGSNELVGHKRPRLFKLYVRHDGMPCLQYKSKVTDTDWLPEEGIEMWAWTDDGHPKLPVGLPKRLPMTEMKMLDEVKAGLQKYIEFYGVVQARIGEEDGKAAFAKLVEYWQDVLHVLGNETTQYRLEDGEELVHGFWPVSKWRDQVCGLSQIAACQLDSPIQYVGPRRSIPRQAYNPRLHIEKGHMILQRPHENNIGTCPVYMGYVTSDVEIENPKADIIEHVCQVKWYRPFMEKKRGQREEYSDEERWINCWTKKWERDLRYKNSEEIYISSVLWSFLPRKKPDTTQTGFVTIPKGAAHKAQVCLAKSVEAEALE